MARYFNGKEVELLAPVGTFEIFKEVIEANCDAVYMGGPNLNMRMIRKGYNFSLYELEEAIQIAHSYGKKVYVTVNNLLSERELPEAHEYLQFLEQVAPDAIIVQDFAVLGLIRDMKLHLPIHSSVMMNVHNLEMIKALKELGVTRVVTSREMDLMTTRYWQAETGMELEYFIHGDMCSVHGANCYFSSLIFGMSSNRGRCLKPCRWDYRVKKDGYVYPAEYPLAAKDMFMYEHIPELIQGGINSFKIEGRMRDAEFILMLVNSYGGAIDRYIADPVGFERNRDTELLFKNRKRDFSTGYAFGRPGLSNMNRRYEGTGKFYSTGKVFSTPTEERKLTEDRVHELKEHLAGVKSVRNDVTTTTVQGTGAVGAMATVVTSATGVITKETTVGTDIEGRRACLAVYVNNVTQARVALEEGADHIYLSGDVYEPDLPFTREDIEEIAGIKGSSSIYMGMPRMMTDLHFEQYEQLLSQDWLPIDGLLLGNIGAIRNFGAKGYPIIGDINLNIYNHMAADFYSRYGVERFTASIELPLEDFSRLIAVHSDRMEMVVHGSPTIMYMDHDLYDNTTVFEAVGEQDNAFVDNSVLVLMTDKGENPVYRDNNGRCHLTLAKELCYLPFLNELREAGLSHFRIEGASYKPGELRKIVRAYRKALDAPEEVGAQFEQLGASYAGYTLGALQFN